MRRTAISVGAFGGKTDDGHPDSSSTANLQWLVHGHRVVSRRKKDLLITGLLQFCSQLRAIAESRCAMSNRTCSRSVMFDSSPVTEATLPAA
jgi:hypothetical protein